VSAADNLRKRLQNKSYTNDDDNYI